MGALVRITLPAILTILILAFLRALLEHRILCSSLSVVPATFVRVYIVLTGELVGTLSLVSRAVDTFPQEQKIELPVSPIWDAFLTTFVILTLRIFKSGVVHGVFERISHPVEPEWQ